jgi:tryptophanyl-tRNA synthetase
MTQAPTPTITKRVLTGITTTGTPHLGNYVGAVRPAIATSREAGVEGFFFLADYHALVKCDEPGRVERSRLEIAATWLAAGLDVERATFYRQSDVPEIPELAWLLTCVASKGLMNRAHAYKAAADANVAAGQDADAGITMGLFSYPVLMAADILMFNAHRVPVGRDQVQHIEMARDLAQRFNHLYGAGHELFVLPEADIDERVAVLPGLDGRKMSKSYDNTAPLFEGGAAGLHAALARVVTDSRMPGEPKEPEGCSLVTIFDAFATDAERAELRAELRAGMAWGDAKAQVSSCIEQQLSPMRARYAELMAHPEHIEQILLTGAQKARAVATPFLAELRHAVGLRRMVAVAAAVDGNTHVKLKTAQPVFKQYREADGQFYFKLVAADGHTLLLQSAAFESGRDAGLWVARLKTEGSAALAQAPVTLAPNISQNTVHEALSALLVEKQQHQ